jgi:hypothetical protein
MNKIFARKANLLVLLAFVIAKGSALHAQTFSHAPGAHSHGFAGSGCMHLNAAFC